jgi:hypothetical protein
VSEDSNLLGELSEEAELLIMVLFFLTEPFIIERIHVRERGPIAGRLMKKRRDYMQNINDILTQSEQEEYNAEPVFYCTHCLSLRVKALDSYVDYCDNCGCTDIETTDIFTWREMYRKRFGKDFC